MQQLRAYLLIRFEESNWEVSVHRDFESIINKWQSLSEYKNKTTILHVGFWRPDTSDFEIVASRFPNRVLVTAAARFALPIPCHVTLDAIDTIQGLPLYLVVSGWGYEIKIEELKLEGINSNKITNVLNNGEKPEYDFYEICGELPSEANILRYLKFAPSWFLKLPITKLNLSVRSQKYFDKESINVIADLVKFGDRGLYGNKKFGSKSISEIPKKLFQLFQNYQIDEARMKLEKIKDEKSFNTFLDSLNFVLSLLSPLQKNVLSMRMGLTLRGNMTLRDIGVALNYSCEGIRRIEKQSIKKIEQVTSWKITLLTHLDALFLERKEHLFLIGIEVLDPWFHGISGVEATFEYVLENFSNKQFSLVRQDDQVFISKTNQTQWDESIELGRNMLESEINNNLTEEDAKSLINSLLIGKGEELRSELWRVITRSAHFVKSQEGKKTLLSFGLGAESKVEAVLMEAKQPLHYFEISKRVEQRYKCSIDVRRSHFAAQNVGILFGRGTFGLMKHFPLSDSECNLLVSEIEDFIDESDIEKQWHCSEICEAMQERNFDFNIHLTPYIVNIALSRSKSFVNLKRMIWAKHTNSSSINNEKRIEIHQAIVSLIKNTGRPMTRNEIREQLILNRGLCEYYQIQQEGSLIRVGKNFWGIKERDLPFSETEAKMIFDRILNILEIRQKGLHISEIKEVLQDFSNIEKFINNPTLFLSLIQKTSKMRVDRGQHIYLAEWTNSRRLSLKEAAFKILASNAPGGLTLDEIHPKIEELIERPVEKNKVSSILYNNEVIFNEKSKRWTLPTEDDKTDIEDIIQAN